MTPVHDARSELLGWFDGTNLFDLDLAWVAFHRAGHLFSSVDAEWLGPLHGGSLLARSGRVFAWLAGTTPAGSLSPSRPMRPMRPLPPRRPLFPPKPLRPAPPLNPVSGWSGLSWLEWLRRPLPPVAGPAVESDVEPVPAEAPAASPQEGGAAS